ncbi:MAG: hypothetical protein U0744_05435 [Gemmataceae bacterium]
MIKMRRIPSEPVSEKDDALHDPIVLNGFQHRVDGTLHVDSWVILWTGSAAAKLSDETMRLFDEQDAFVRGPFGPSSQPPYDVRGEGDVVVIPPKHRRVDKMPACQQQRSAAGLCVDRRAQDSKRAAFKSGSSFFHWAGERASVLRKTSERRKSGVPSGDEVAGIVCQQPTLEVVENGVAKPKPASRVKHDVVGNDRTLGLPRLYG